MQNIEKNESNIHTLSVYVANKPGVLARIAQVFARRGFNIESLVVSSSVDGDYSRMTITAKGDPSGLQQIIEAVRKLIDVIHCVDHTGENTVVKELGLIKIACTPAARTEALQIADHFGAETVDMTDASMMLMITGDTEKLDAMISLLKKFRIMELVRTGKVVMARGGEET